jgi:hypothetical protein
MEENFKIGRVYKITSQNTDKIYIGSTTKNLKRRLQGHLANYKRYINNKYEYTTSYEILKYEDAKIELIEEIEYIDIIDLRKRERHFIELYRKDCVNKYIPTRTQKESIKIYRTNHKEETKEYNKNYHNKNKGKIYIDCKCACGGKYKKSNKTNHIRTNKHSTFIINVNATTVNIHNGNGES